MRRQIKRLLKWWYVAGAGIGVFQAQGCLFDPNMLDPDITLRAGLSAGSDLAIFLLENLANSL